MRKIIIMLSLTLLCTQHILFSMDPAITDHNKVQKIITVLNNQIKEKYSSHKGGFVGLFFVNMATAEALELIQLAEKVCHPEMIDIVYDELCDRNHFFAMAVNHFISLASKNLELLTANNIKIIENPKKLQPISELNHLSLSKPYIMNRAIREVGHTHDIKLAGKHVDPISAFDICELTHQAVTSSFNNTQSSRRNHQWNNRFILWDLKTGNTIRFFEEPDPIYILLFNPDGSRIAAALFNENIIKIWCPQTGQLLNKLPSAQSISSLAYSEPTGSILTGYSLNATDPFYGSFQQWAINPIHAQDGDLITSIDIDSRRSAFSHFCGKTYRAVHPQNYVTTPENELHITKLDYNHLYLCLQAIKKTKNPERNLIESSASFIALTDLEKIKVHAEINKKLALQ